MTFFRLSLCAAVLIFAHCSHFGAPDSGDAESKPPTGTGSPETVDLTLAIEPTFGAAPAPVPPPPIEPVKVKPTRVAQTQAKSSPPIPPMPKTKESPTIDRSNLLNLMREPKER